MKDEPNKITATLKVVITGEFYDDEASEETLRYCVEQDLEDDGFDVDIDLLKEQEAKTGHWIDTTKVFGFPRVQCSVCGSEQGAVWMYYCPICGAKMSPLALPASGG